MASKDEIKKFTPAEPMRESIPDALAMPSPDLSGVEDKVQKAIFALLQEIAILKAKTAHLPISSPVHLPQKENNNTDYVAGL